MAAKAATPAPNWWESTLNNVFSVGAEAIKGYTAVTTIKEKAAADQAAADAVLKSREYDLAQQSIDAAKETPKAAISLSGLTITPTYLAFGGAAIVAAYFAFKK